MQCSVTVAVVLFYLASVCSQTPPSTNPAGFTYFSPSVVSDLALNSTVSGTIYDSTGNVYNQYWRVWIPQNVGGVKYTLKNTSPSSTANYVYVSINFVYGRQDISNAFSCAHSDYTTSYFGMPACLNVDAYWGAYAGEEASDTYTAGDDFIPGNWHYITVNKYYNDGNAQNYTLSLESTFECRANNTVGVYSSYYMYCFNNTVIQSVTQSGQSFSGVLVNQDQQVYFRVNPPQNTSRVWAWITSAASSASIYACEGYICTYSYDAMEYTYSWVSYNSSVPVYNYYLEMDLPDYGTPVYYTLSSSYQNSGYSIQFLWSACGSSYAGYGAIQQDPYTPNSTFSIPDCSDPVSYKNIVEPFSSVTFSVPAYNSTIDNYAAAAYGFMYIQTTSVGSLNISCSSTADGSFFVMSRGSLTDCQTYSYFRFCSGPTYSQDYLTMLSEDLYPGGYFSIAVCSKATDPVTIQFNPGGSVVLPSASPTPSMTPTPSSSPSAAPDSDSSVGHVIFPALVIIGLAIITILF